MILTSAILISGLLTVTWSSIGFFLMLSKFPAEKIFTESKPVWIGFLAWLYLALALLIWHGFLQNLKPMPLLAVGLVTITAAKFLFFFATYIHWRKIFILLWDNRGALSGILASSLLVGALMILTAKLIG